jgi:hypothetical protein
VDATLRVNGYFPDDGTLLDVVAQALHKADSDAVRQECGNQHVDFLLGEASCTVELTQHLFQSYTLSCWSERQTRVQSACCWSVYAPVQSALQG